MLLSLPFNFHQKKGTTKSQLEIDPERRPPQERSTRLWGMTGPTLFCCPSNSQYDQW